MSVCVRATKTMQYETIRNLCALRKTKKKKEEEYHQVHAVPDADYSTHISTYVSMYTRYVCAL